MSLTYDEIAEIIKLIDSSSCDELIVETGDIKLVVRRNGAAPGAAAEYVERGSAPVTVSSAAPRKVRGAAPKGRSCRGSDRSYRSDGRNVLSRAQSGGAAFRRVGSVVGVGEPLCLIEVMKLFTTINAEIAGRIVQIGAENGELVEYGRTLFVIEPV